MYQTDNARAEQLFSDVVIAAVVVSTVMAISSLIDLRKIFLQRTTNNVSFHSHHCLNCNNCWFSGIFKSSRACNLCG